MNNSPRPCWSLRATFWPRSLWWRMAFSLPCKDLTSQAGSSTPRFDCSTTDLNKSFERTTFKIWEKYEKNAIPDGQFMSSFLAALGFCFDLFHWRCNGEYLAGIISEVLLGRILGRGLQIWSTYHIPTPLLFMHKPKVSRKPMKPSLLDEWRF